MIRIRVITSIFFFFLRVTFRMLTLLIVTVELLKIIKQRDSNVKTSSLKSLQANPVSKTKNLHIDIEKIESDVETFIQQRSVSKHNSEMTTPCEIHTAYTITFLLTFARCY